ncbi:hypothetical protein EUGRSUZ_D01276 [Eucalyptus grandis]|uniref:Uncharacterized protein n=2 Tax=Eucalyptus grandis TaxID=71139 RepID=A0ACC3L5G1_EUCGR|nr:hypothetical protein EUGRSUZ_D01276 [Eucalyptus grandis]
MGWTPLHYAACFGNVKAVGLLLKQDTSVAYVLDKEEESALHIAAFRGHVPIIDMLVTSCPDTCDMINTKWQTALNAAVIGGQDLINEEDTDGNTALHLAAVHRRYRIVYTLARDKRVNHFATNKDHLTAFDIFFTSEEVSLRIIGVLPMLMRSHGFPVIHDWVIKHVKKRLDTKFVGSQPAGSITTGNNTANRENSESIKSIVDSQLLVAAFVATVTFAATFTMPGGYNNDGPNQGMATLAGKVAFKAFVIFNTIAFSFSTQALFVRYDTSCLSDQQKMD